MSVRFACGLAAWPIALTLLGASPVLALEVIGKTEATLHWSAASGPVAGYYVIVSRGGGTPVVEGISANTQQTIRGHFGETLTIQVAAFDERGVPGPVSRTSEPLRFKASAPGSVGGGLGDSTPGAGGLDPDSGAEEPIDADGSGAPFDLTGDGRSDLLVHHGGRVELWAMRDASVESVRELPRVPRDARLVASGDYDGNGTTDLLWESEAFDAQWISLLEAGAVVGGEALEESGLESDARWRVAGSADFDADGRDDLLLTSRVLGLAEIWSMEGASVRARRRIEGRVGAWSVVGLVDADADGGAEILWRDELEQVLELDDPNGVESVRIGGPVSGWRVVGTGDVDGDARAEIVLRHIDSGALQLWTLEGAEIVETSWGSADGWGSWELTASGDPDGDGAVGGVWRHPTTGQIAVGLTPQRVDREVPPGATLESGARVARDLEFRGRFCSGDVNGSGRVNASDVTTILGCRGQPAQGTCETADLDGDGSVGRVDAQIALLRMNGVSCGQTL